MRQGELPSKVDAPCGTINHLNGQGTGRMNRDGSECKYGATQFIKTDDETVEVLTCKRHLDRARDRIKQVE